ncbi:MAG: acyltransferase, partial [Phycisphaerales bacterium]
LRWFGATVDDTSRVRPSVWIDRPWNLSIGRKSSLGDRCSVYAHAPIRIGARSVCSQHTILSAGVVTGLGAEASMRPAPITLGDDVWVAADCVVEGGSTIPDGALVGARSAVRDDRPLEAWTIAGGMPARSLKARPFKGRDL